VLLGAFLGELRGYRGVVGVALGLHTVATLVGLLMPLSMKVAIDYIIAPVPGAAEAVARLELPGDRGVLLWMLGGAMVVLTLFGTAVTMVGRYQMTRLSKVVQARMRRRVFSHLSRLPLERLAHLKSGGVASIVRDDAGVIGEMLFSVLYNPWRAVLTFVGGLLAMALLDWRMLVGGLLMLPVVYFTHRTWISRIRPVYGDIKKTRTETDAHATEVFSGVRVVRAFGRGRAEVGRFTRSTHLMARQEMLAWWWSRFIDVGWTVLIPTATAGVLVYGGNRVMGGDLTVGDVAAFSTYLLLLLGPLEVLVSTASGLQNSLAGFDRCLDVLAEPREFEGKGGGGDARGKPGSTDLGRGGRGQWQVRGAPTVRFEGVSFAYPGHEQEVLSGVDLVCPAGKTVALVGASGSGKTTLCNLVARFFDPTVGRVTVDGVDLREVPLEGYRAGLGIVEQEVFLFDGTVAENIAYGRPRATMEEVVRAARAANADGFVRGLEGGYETVIGERGVRLSGGQRQRIAIARAILADPRVLILDEATSSLDSQSEALIQAALTDLLKERTSFVIAHRLGTVRNADLIVVLEKGRVAESGTHEELLARRGMYFEMLAVQLHTNRDYAGIGGKGEEGEGA
jgi:ATP-binding cassette subfamily B protein/subfamily B ATP-binding cassette protein MsbA